MVIPGTIQYLKEGLEMDSKPYLELQNREIQRHKWIESEKAGRDLGMEAAIQWILRHADQFSDYLVQTEVQKQDESPEPSARS
jgi:hypothetical protein